MLTDGDVCSCLFSWCCQAFTVSTVVSIRSYAQLCVVEQPSVKAHLSNEVTEQDHAWLLPICISRD